VWLRRRLGIYHRIGARTDQLITESDL